MRLINGHTAKKFIHEHNPGGKMLKRETVLKLLDSLPEIDPVHAAGRCYCRECKFYREIRTKRYKQIMRWCMKRDGAEFHVQPNDFCSYGRRREGADGEEEKARQNL